MILPHKIAQNAQNGNRSPPGLSPPPRARRGEPGIPLLRSVPQELVPNLSAQFAHRHLDNWAKSSDNRNCS